MRAGTLGARSCLRLPDPHGRSKPLALWSALSRTRIFEQCRFAAARSLTLSDLASAMVQETYAEEKNDYGGKLFGTAMAARSEWDFLDT